jgi:hypothetical protein
MFVGMEGRADNVGERVGREKADKDDELDDDNLIFVTFINSIDAGSLSRGILLLVTPCSSVTFGELS